MCVWNSLVLVIMSHFWGSSALGREEVAIAATVLPLLAVSLSGGTVEEGPPLAD